MNQPDDSNEVVQAIQSKYRHGKTLTLCKRGINTSLRHFMPEFLNLIPYHVKHNKFRGSEYVELNMIADKNNCSSVFMLESRNDNEFYAWLSSSPSGPTVCFYLENLHSAESVNGPGQVNPMTRPLLVFDHNFESMPVFALCKELLKKSFGMPNKIKRRSEVDTVLSFFVIEGRIWVRRYQILWDAGPLLLEAGPRFCMQPVVILGGSFCGAKLWKSSTFVPPHKQMRRRIKKQ